MSPEQSLKEFKLIEPDIPDWFCIATYVNSMGLRWAILTNGKQWLFFDNKQEGVATDRLVMTIDLTTSYAADHLEKLLAPAVWRSDQANQTTLESIRLLKIEAKLRQVMQKGCTRDRGGLEVAIENNKLNADERQFAESRFEEFYHRIILSDMPTTSSSSPVQATAVVLASEFPAQMPVVVKPQAEILQLLRDKIEMVSQANPTHRFDIAATLNGVEIKANSWRNTFTGVAEVFVSLGREQEIQGHIFDFPAKEEDGYQYRQLSNGKYLRVDWSAKTYRRHINKWLRKLQLPTKVLAVTYKDETYYLPSPVSTSVASPSRDIKETSFPPITSPKPAVAKSQPEILQLLREKIEMVSQNTLAKGFDVTVRLEGVEVKANTWRDVFTGIAETFFSLGREGEIQKYIFDSSEQKENLAYRQLSNGKYLLVNFSANEHQKHINKCLKMLQLSSEILAVTYREETYYLPNKS